MTQHLIHAYRQAPWRTQLQWIGIFLLTLVVVASVAAVYLNISARAATTGREIQSMEYQTESLERQIADLETKLAYLTSAAQMEKRANDMGFVQVEAASERYLVIPGYIERPFAELAPAPGPDMVKVPLLRANYTQSLWELLFQSFLTPTDNTNGKVQP